MGGGSGLGPGVGSKCVIVAKLTRKSKRGQCADRTLGCMIHRRGLKTTSVKPHHPILAVSLHYGTSKAISNHACGLLHHLCTCKQRQTETRLVGQNTFLKILHQKFRGKKKLHVVEITKKTFPDRTFQQMSVNMCNMI